MDAHPYLHDLAVCVRAPTAVLGGTDGQLRKAAVPGRIHGVFCADVRALALARLLVDGAEPEPLGAYDEGAGRVRFEGVVRHLGDAGTDPTVRVTRTRTATAEGLAEEIVVASTATDPVTADVRLELGTDLARIETVRSGGADPDVGPDVDADGVRWTDADGWVRVHAAGGAAGTGGPGGADLTWRLRVHPGESAAVRWRLTVTDDHAVVVPPRAAPSWSTPEVTADDPRLAALLHRALADLDALRLATAERPDETFLGAGAPWYLTLFGRDSLLAARMLLPLGTGLAASTLATLAAFQGERDDPETGEAPGKVLHELRRAQPVRQAGRSGGLTLPPRYYGTVDATMLWVTLLHDAWRWGLEPQRIEPLLPHLDRALGWITGPAADPDGDGFVEYVDASGRGLANQGWKDSPDAVRYRDGRLAAGPVALCEVQGYAYAAATGGADLLDAFGRPGSDRLRAYAGELAGRFRDRFWVADERGPYPALALDGDKRPADALTSNVGHLLGTGLLDADEEATVAARLVAPDLDSGYGLRTMSSGNGGYAPLSYHCGSVWPHDTALVVDGLRRAGHGAAAAQLALGLLAAAPGFGGRLPELYAGDAARPYGAPVPYPVACRPQAWSAAAAVLVLQALLGLDADVPAGVVRLAPVTPSPVGAVRADGLVVGDGRLTVALDRDGRVTEASSTVPDLAVSVQSSQRSSTH